MYCMDELNSFAAEHTLYRMKNEYSPNMEQKVNERVNHYVEKCNRRSILTAAGRRELRRDMTYEHVENDHMNCENCRVTRPYAEHRDHLEDCIAGRSPVFRAMMNEGLRSSSKTTEKELKEIQQKTLVNLYIAYLDRSKLSNVECVTCPTFEDHMKGKCIRNTAGVCYKIATEDIADRKLDSHIRFFDLETENEYEVTEKLVRNRFAIRNHIPAPTIESDTPETDEATQQLNASFWKELRAEKLRAQQFRHRSFPYNLSIRKKEMRSQMTHSNRKMDYMRDDLKKEIDYVLAFKENENFSVLIQKFVDDHIANPAYRPLFDGLTEILYSILGVETTDRFYQRLPPPADQ